MVARSQREIRQRAPVWLIGLLFFNLALMAFDARDEVSRERLIRVWAQAVLAPFQSAATGAGGAGIGFFQRLVNLRNADVENQDLKRRVEQMEVELRNTRSAADENERLKALLDLKQNDQYQMVTARVIARDPSIWFNTVTLDRGRTSGIQTNMPVVTPGGIVGRVIATSPWTSMVMLITDEKAAAGAIVGQLGQSSALGSIKGLGVNGLVEMKYVSGMEKVNVGDFVTTTGQDGIYPPGLSVGEVVEVKPGSATTAHVIHIKPSAHINSLNEVAVLLYHPPPRVAPDEKLPNVVDKGKVSSK